MRDLIKWYKNRLECIDNDIDIPLPDFLICIGSLPFLVLLVIVLLVTLPIWGLPYMIWQIKGEQP